MKVLSDPNRYDVTVAYRIYPRVSKSPAAFATDKLRLAELCLKSFRDSIGELRVKMLVLLDSCPPEYESLFRKYFASDDLVLIQLPGVGNRGTFSRQIELLLEQEYSELVYFAEDDYFYLPGQFASLVRLMQSRVIDVHFVTPYDHRDYYTLPLHRFVASQVTLDGHQWRTVASTCLTFLTSKKVLRQTSRVFRVYGRSKRATDFGIWFSLTKVKIRNPITLLGSLKGDWLPLAVMGTTWYYNWHQVLFGKSWNLWAPAPTVATHMDANFMAPGLDWPGILAAAAESLS